MFLLMTISFLRKTWTLCHPIQVVIPTLVANSGDIIAEEKYKKVCVKVSSKRAFIVEPQITRLEHCNQKLKKQEKPERESKSHKSIISSHYEFPPTLTNSHDLLTLLRYLCKV